MRNQIKRTFTLVELENGTWSLKEVSLGHVKPLANKDSAFSVVLKILHILKMPSLAPEVRNLPN